eukprot:Hpha_TRINITY_DN2959_c0_g1::TRINITY_DN2959_c0_g1_i1::g.19784::m.19784
MSEKTSSTGVDKDVTTPQGPPPDLVLKPLADAPTTVPTAAVDAPAALMHEPPDAPPSDKASSTAGQRTPEVQSIDGSVAKLPSVPSRCDRPGSAQLAVLLSPPSVQGADEVGVEGATDERAMKADGTPAEWVLAIGKGSEPRGSFRSSERRGSGRVSDRGSITHSSRPSSAAPAPHAPSVLLETDQGLSQSRLDRTSNRESPAASAGEVVEDDLSVSGVDWKATAALLRKSQNAAEEAARAAQGSLRETLERLRAETERADAADAKLAEYLSGDRSEGAVQERLRRAERDLAKEKRARREAEEALERERQRERSDGVRLKVQDLGTSDRSGPWRSPAEQHQSPPQRAFTNNALRAPPPSSAYLAPPANVLGGHPAGGHHLNPHAGASIQPQAPPGHHPGGPHLGIHPVPPPGVVATLQAKLEAAEREKDTLRQELRSAQEAIIASANEVFQRDGTIVQAREALRSVLMRVQDKKRGKTHRPPEGGTPLVAPRRQAPPEPRSPPRSSTAECLIAVDRQPLWRGHPTPSALPVPSPSPVLSAAAHRDPLPLPRESSLQTVHREETVSDSDARVQQMLRVLGSSS